MIDKTIEVERMEHVISVFGSFDQNLRIIENELSVKVLDRDNMIHICGEEESVMLAEKAINGLLTLAAKGENIDAQNVRYILKLVSEGKETKINELAGDVVCITAKGNPHPSRRRSGGAPRLPARRPAEQGRPVPAPAV